MANAVTKSKEAEITAFDPSMFEQDAGKGMENMGQEDLALPFLKLISGLDPLLDDENFKGRKGDIYNTVTGAVHKGKEGVKVIPCAYQRLFIEWAPRGVGSGAPVNIFSATEARPKTERSSEDNKEYVVGGQGTYLEETHQHFVLVVKEDGAVETALIAMKSTQLKKSRKWNSMMQSITMQGKNGPFTPPRFSSVYTLRSVGEENSKGAWHGWDMSREGPVEDASTYQRARTFAQSITDGEVIVKHEGDTPASNETDDIPF